MDKIPVRCGFDIAKHVMVIHAVNHSGKVVPAKNKESSFGNKLCSGRFRECPA